MTGFQPLEILSKADLSNWNNSIFYRSWPTTWEEVWQPHFVILVAIIVAVITFIWAFAFRNIKTKVEEVTARIVGTSKPRFRKRDKVMFYGRKMLRKVSTFSIQAVGGRSRMKKRQMVLRFAKRLLRMKRDQPLTLQVKEPSQAFLEEDVTEQSEQRLPPEVIYMLKSIRVFGFFEKPLFLDICKNIEVISLSADNLLFSIGDPDDSIYVVQSGRLQVFVTEPDGTELVLKEVPPGESIASLLSVMDVLTGHVAPYKTVSARAIKDSNILRLRVQVFKQLLEKYPESLVRVAQIIMIRLHRVTFTALHNYLGLTTQLMNPASVYKKISVVASPKASPSRPSTLRVVPEVRETPLKIGVKSLSLDTPIPESPYELCPPSDNTLNTTASLDISSAPPSPQKVAPGVTAFHELQKTRRRRTSFMLLDEKGQPLETGDLLRVATEGFMLHLGLEDPSLLKDRISIQEHPAGIYLTREEMHSDAVLYFILSGTLVVSQKTVDKDAEETLFIAYPGEVVGALAVITGEPSLFTVKTRYACRLGVMSKNNIYEILRKRPKAVLELARAVIKRLSSFVRQIDFALDWMHIESGRAIYRQGDSSDSTYIVLSGRLRSVLTRSDGKKELVGEYGRGDLVGIVEVLTQTERSTTVMAVRDSELAKLPDGLLNAIKIKYPVVVTRLVHLLGHRILGTLQKDDALTAKKGPYLSYIRPSASNFATVAVLSVTDDVPLSAFTMELYHALTSIGPVLRITSDIIKKNLGASVLESANEYRLCSWLGQQEDQHRIVLYQCDTHFSAWTQRCIRQADCILIVALADQEPTVGQIEKQLEHLAVRTQKELVLLHKEGADKPRNTVQWLNMRSWCSSHHHIRCPKRMFAKKSLAKIMEQYNKLFETPPSLHSDFSRLARFLTGTSIGLVLGGGGARGAAHVGMIRAIQEAGIPVDMVGGVSIGAFMGALWCQEINITTFTQKARDWSFKMTSYWRQILDLTYPVTAMFTGAAFNRTIHEVFGERQIEDLWLPYFTVTTDITESTMRVHTHGSLWRYIRSSMSLSGYMPPLCDPVDGHLLLDGGYVNNLPADIMREMGAETIIAVDVGSQDEMDLTNYGDTLSGWWLLWKRWNPWASPVRVPSLPEIQSRLAYVSCVRQLEQVKRSDYCTYVRPPIDKYKTLQFGSFDEIMDVGYNHGKTIFTTLKRGHRSLHSFIHNEKMGHHHHTTNLRDASFTDLAEMVCKIQPPRRLQVQSDVSDSEFEDEDPDDLYISEPESNILEEVTKPSVPRRRKLGSCSNIDADSL